MYLGDFKSFKTSKAGSIDDCVNTWCTKKQIFKISLLERKTTVIKQNDNKFFILKTIQACHAASTKSLGNYQIRK